MHDRTTFIHNHECYLTTVQYSCNNRVGLQMYYYDEECETYFPYATLTVNIPEHAITNSNCVFLDTNNAPFSLDLLCKKLRCAKPTGKFVQSGFCLYPEVELNPERLSKYIYYAEEVI